MLIKRGAEAEIHTSTWLGRKVIVKKRVAKKYRLKEIDDVLRKLRTKKEAKLISEARYFGVRTPIIYDIDLYTYQITMEYIDPSPIKNILNDMDKFERKELCLEIGRNIAKLHKNDLIHGDLTTSNIILKDEKLFFIDFGLGDHSSEIEAKGVDLHVLLEAFNSTHSEILEAFNFVLEGYKDYDKADDVIKKLDEIAKRGRYT